ncbi:MAG TPA: Uma2 family endonuclease [Pyrinomonadaceae bacterium]|nr:Uma2 family endonuclease [Pyrinomonadaceae bacterium]
MTVTTQLLTAEDLLKLHQDGLRYELLEGELRRMPPAGHEHGDVTMNIAAPLHRHVKSNGLGKVYAAETGFLLQTNPDTIRAPDVAFVRRERAEQVSKNTGYWPGAPDLAVEVVRPGDTVSRVEEKVQEWLKFDVRLVWIVSPKLRTVTAYRSLTDVVVLKEKDTLDGGDVVPGWRMPVDDLFE